MKNILWSILIVVTADIISGLIFHEEVTYFNNAILMSILYLGATIIERIDKLNKP